MPDYKEMYLELFRTQARAIEMLQQVMLKTEEMAMEEDAAAIALAAGPEPDDTSGKNQDNA